MTCSARRSSWICVSALLLASTPAWVWAQSDVLEVQPADRERIITEPRQVVATAFSVRNVSPRSLETQARLVLPDGWQAVGAPAMTGLAPGESLTRLVSFMVPQDARSGDFSVSYQVWDARQPTAVETSTIRVTVSAAPSVQVTALDTPEYAIAGERYASTFLVRNNGNTPVDVSYGVRGRRGARPRPASGTIHLEPGDAKRVDVAVDTPAGREHVATRVTFSAKVDGTGVSSSASSATELVPRASALDRYETLNARLDTRYIAREAQGHRTSGWQPELSGRGVLDQERGDFLSFRLRGPDARDSGSFGSPDEYWVKYDSQSIVAAAGDLNYGLSDLTEPGRFGRGATLGFKAAEWGASAYQMKDVYSHSGGTQSGLNAWYEATEATRVDLNVLDRTDTSMPATIASLRSRTQWADQLRTELELAESHGGIELGHAARGALYDNRYPLRYYLVAWAADAEFRGYLRDKKYVSTGFEYPNSRGWGFQGYYRVQDWNLLPVQEIDPDLLEHENAADLLQSAPTLQQASLGTSHSIGGGVRATLDYIVRDRTGGTSLAPVDTRSDAWRIGIARSWSMLSFHYSAEMGSAVNRVSQSRFGTSLHTLSAYLRAGRFQTYGMYATRDEGSYLDAQAPAQHSYGLTANYAVGTALSVGLEAQRYRSPVWLSEMYNFSLAYRQESGSELKFVARRFEGRFARTDVLLSFSVPFEMPFVRKSGVMPLRGRVFDEATGDGLGDVLLRLEGLTAVTDSRGQFEFPAVRAGEYRMVMDRANVELDEVPASGQSLAVSVAEKATAPLDIPMVRAATLAVRVILETGESRDVHGAAGVIVTARSGETVLHRLTDADGTVRLEGLSPGRWEVGVTADSVPRGYQAPSRETRLDLAQGGVGDVEISMQLEKRTMRMLAPVKVSP
ncbi:MAG: hypothetical protein WDO68_10750 [Gammaproteobacteria bacterium]